MSFSKVLTVNLIYLDSNKTHGQRLTSPLMMGGSCHPSLSSSLPEKFESKVSIKIFCHFLNLLAPYLAYVLAHSVATLGQLHTQECSLRVSMEVRSITYCSIWSTQKILIRKKE